MEAAGEPAGALPLLARTAQLPGCWGGLRWGGATVGAGGAPVRAGSRAAAGSPAGRGCTAACDHCSCCSSQGSGECWPAATTGLMGWGSRMGTGPPAPLVAGAEAGRTGELRGGAAAWTPAAGANWGPGGGEAAGVVAAGGCGGARLERCSCGGAWAGGGRAARCASGSAGRGKCGANAGRAAGMRGEVGCWGADCSARGDGGCMRGDGGGG